MAAKGITHLIVNSPYEEPEHHWLYYRETQKFTLGAGRHPAGQCIAETHRRQAVNQQTTKGHKGQKRPKAKRAAKWPASLSSFLFFSSLPRSFNHA